MSGVDPETLLTRCTFPAPGTALDCGVSGGADSLSLLALAVAAGCEVTAVHVDHGLRTGSTDEAELVAAVAARLGAKFRSERVLVEPGANLEARARAARHRVLGPDAALGHTADDRAETMLINLVRGAGPEGLSSLRPGPRHPIVGLRRAETVALCASMGFEPFEDPMNLDPAFVRTRVRQEVLPLLAEIARRDVVPVLVRQAEVFADIADHLRASAESIEVTDADVLATAPTAVARIAVREWLRAESVEHHPPDAATVERVLAVARGDAVGTEIAGGRRVRRTDRRLRIEPASGGESLH